MEKQLPFYISDLKVDSSTGGRSYVFIIPLSIEEDALKEGQTLNITVTPPNDEGKNIDVVIALNDLKNYKEMQNG